jgi:hypothetical protein
MNGQKAFHSNSEVIKHSPTSIGVMGAKLESNMIEGLIRHVNGGDTNSDSFSELMREITSKNPANCHPGVSKSDNLILTGAVVPTSEV